ncbi:uncharacterized protein [Cherax quadricarinatus]|uniref:uncharacterized protein isoform X2 n=1 Tax=Cherax quadricarinatus TaxID=27406 RepID=UPI00387E6C19
MQMNNVIALEVMPVLIAQCSTKLELRGQALQALELHTLICGEQLVLMGRGEKTFLILMSSRSGLKTRGRLYMKKKRENLKREKLLIVKILTRGIVEMEGEDLVAETEMEGEDMVEMTKEEALVEMTEVVGTVETTEVAATAEMTEEASVVMTEEATIEVVVLVAIVVVTMAEMTEEITVEMTTEVDMDVTIEVEVMVEMMEEAEIEDMKEMISHVHPGGVITLQIRIQAVIIHVQTRNPAMAVILIRERFASNTEMANSGETIRHNGCNRFFVLIFGFPGQKMKDRYRRIPIMTFCYF